MSTPLIEDMKEFLNNAYLSTYETNAYMALLISNDLTARDLSERSNVPTGRIYEILEELKDKGMIEIQDSRPKKYRALAFNTAFSNLIAFIERKNQRKVTYLINQAKELETRIYNSDLLIKQEPSKIFWSTAYGLQSIMALYVKRINELEEELIMTGFLNEYTLKVIPFGKMLFDSIFDAVKRGVKVRYLWSFEYDERPLSEEQIERNHLLFNQAKDMLESLYGSYSAARGFKTKCIHKRIPTMFDLFDSKRVLFKLQNPLNPNQIFAAMNVLDPHLAGELKNKFMNIWHFDAEDFYPDLNRRILR